MEFNFKANSGINDKYSIHCEDAKILAERLIRQNTIVDHIITDPPYNISKKNNFGTLKSPRKGVDFGEWDKEFDLYSWIPEFLKILAKNGSLIVFCSYRYLSHLIDSIEENEMTVKDVIVWQKSNPMPRNRDRRYVQDMEFAVWAVRKKSKWIFNRGDHPYLRSLFTSATVSGKEKNGHPTQKSLKIMEELVKIHTNEGQLVLDPFMGSGTTGVACLRNNRNFIGCEINSEYFEISKGRLLGGSYTTCDS